MHAFAVERSSNMQASEMFYAFAPVVGHVASTGASGLGVLAISGGYAPRGERRPG